METQKVFVRRSVQGRCYIPRGGDHGAGHPDMRRTSDLRHGWSVTAADLAIQPAVRQADSRLATSTNRLRVLCSAKNVSILQ